MGWEAHVTSLDPTLDIGTRSCAIRRGMSKKRATAIFDLSLRVGPPFERAPALCVLRGLLCKFSLLSSVSPRFRSGGLKILAKLRDVPCQQFKGGEYPPTLPVQSKCPNSEGQKAYLNYARQTSDVIFAG